MGEQAFKKLEPHSEPSAEECTAAFTNITQSKIVPNCQFVQYELPLYVKYIQLSVPERLYPPLQL